MKTALFFLLLLAARCFAGSIALEWDPNDEADLAYTVEAQPGDGSDPVAWKALQSTSETWIALTGLKSGPWAFRVKAVAKKGATSQPSNVFTQIITPDPPGNLRQKIVLQASDDMQTWTAVAVYEVPESDRQFYRITFQP